MNNSEKKNVILIFTDQMHKFALNCMGTDDIITPNLDTLAEEGVLFRNAYSNCPICTPFRINLFSGLYTNITNAYRNESKLPRRKKSLADEFNSKGYFTSFIGKWHIGNNGNSQIPKKLMGGFQSFMGFQCFNGFYKNVWYWDENQNLYKFDKHRTDVTTDLSINKLEEIKDKPFFMCIGYQAPHYPEQPAPKYEEMYKNTNIKRRKNIQEIDPYTGTHSPRSPRPKENCPDYQKYGNDLDEYIKLYYAMVTQIDTNVGRIIQKLKELNLDKKTVIIFTSDHGDMQGSHGMKNKTKPYEESAGIPLIIKDPDGLKGKIVDCNVSGVDFYPTCLEYAGIKSERNDLSGHSLVPLTSNNRTKDEFNYPVFSEMRDWKMIKYKNWKLIVRGKKYTLSEFYDLKNDPYEMDNLINNPEHQEKIVSLRNVIIKWMKKKNYEITW